MKHDLSNAAIRRRHLRRGIIALALGAFFCVSLVCGWILAGGDPNFTLSSRRGSPPLWAATIWITLFGSGIVAFGVWQLRVAALFRDDDDDDRTGR